MPNETPLARAIREERRAHSAAEEAKRFGLPAEALNQRLNALTAARAATDEAVRKVEARIVERDELLGAYRRRQYFDGREGRMYSEEQYSRAKADIARLEAVIIDEVVSALSTPAPTAQGESTGGRNER